MALSRRAVDFNKEILIGEIGALAGAPLFGVIGSLIISRPDVISTFTVLGSILGGFLSWFITRIYDERKEEEFSAKKLARKLSLYTPAAFLVSILIGYPVVFFVTRTLSMRDNITAFSSLMGELSGFVIFLILINTYRYVLLKYFNKML